MEGQQGGDIVRIGMTGVLVSDPATDTEQTKEAKKALNLARMRALALLQGIMQNASPTQEFYRRGLSPLLGTLMI